MAQDLHAQTRTAAAAFSDRLAAAVERKRSQLCVGLDPVVELLPVELRGDPPADATARFCRGIVDAVARYAVAVKPQLAFFEALGADGVRAFEEVCAYARAAELLVIVDGKRGDIESTGRGYAAAYLEPRGGAPALGDALTVNPYMGRDAVEPFRRRAAGTPRESFASSRPRTPGSADVQDLALSDGRPVWMQVAELVDVWVRTSSARTGSRSAGAVVGKDFPRQVGDARRPTPRVAFRPALRHRRARRYALPTLPALQPGLQARSSPRRARSSTCTAPAGATGARRPAPMLGPPAGGRLGRRRLVNRRWATRLAAPAAFLAGVTVAILLVRAGLDDEATTTAAQTSVADDGPPDDDRDRDAHAAAPWRCTCASRPATRSTRSRSTTTRASSGC